MNAVLAHPAPVALPPIESAEQIPPYSENLCRPGGQIRLRDEDAKLVALLEVAHRQVLVLWAGSPSERRALVAAQARASTLGYRIMSVRNATIEVIALCSEEQAAHGEDSLESTDATRMFDEWLARAVAMKASDLHIMLMRTHAMVRVRVDGELVNLAQVRTGVAESVARAMYTQAEVDSRRGQPSFNNDEFQDAAISRTISVGGKVEELKLRWASGPVWPDAFDVSIRILNIGQETRERTLEKLGFNASQQAALGDALKDPAGVILLCGRTGDGKSTTLATLADMWGARTGGTRLMRTIEDPPEYLIKVARQMPVSRTGGEGGATGFHRALRAAMRMDPDSILVGEVRDEITADLLQQVIQTGHKAFATVHAGSPFTALWRLEELGIKRARLVDEGFINAIVHQTLVPVLCRHCARPMSDANVPPDLHEQLAAALDSEQLAAVRVRGPACEHCHNGVSGRRAIAEILLPDTRMRVLLRKGEDMEAIDYWRSGTMPLHGDVQARSLTAQAMELIGSGLVSPLDAELIVGRLHP